MYTKPPDIEYNTFHNNFYLKKKRNRKEGGKSEKPALKEAFAEMMIEVDDVFAGNHDLYYLK